MSSSDRRPGPALTHWQGEPVHVWADLWGVPAVEAWDVVGSTNDRARGWSLEGARPWSVVVADAQSAGRGRAGRRWVSASGHGLWFSVVLPDASGPPELVPLRTGLAVVQALRATLDAGEIGVKWPNDLWWRDRKLGGILCESRAGETVVGVGLNLRTPSVDLVDAAPVGLEEITGEAVPRARLLGALVRRLRDVLDRGGPRLSDAELRALAAHDRLRDRAVSWSEGPGGIARGVASDGSLELETDHGTRHIRSGSVRPIAREGGGSRSTVNVEGEQA
ncbi:MAG TPA: biotin--[acetyl-CoA-carboxylase] ligase [Longimicrobiales bacterium]|nr:biotin--[acetyl-CoA-carboxylase] ligase [Longimicrobiales bacterium]